AEAHHNLRVDTKRQDSNLNQIGEQVLSPQPQKTQRARHPDQELDPPGTTQDNATSPQPSAGNRTPKHPVGKVLSPLPHV
ncbi:chemotaxis protein CheA, partial [Stenotrophomonas maltophilia]